jgi:hypothetical protein
MLLQYHLFHLKVAEKVRHISFVDIFVRVHHQDDVVTFILPGLDLVSEISEEEQSMWVDLILFGVLMCILSLEVCPVLPIDRIDLRHSSFDRSAGGNDAQDSLVLAHEFLPHISTEAGTIFPAIDLPEGSIFASNLSRAAILPYRAFLYDFLLVVSAEGPSAEMVKPCRNPFQEL